MDTSILSYSEFSIILFIHSLIYLGVVFLAAKLACRNPKILEEKNLDIIGWKRQVILLIAVIFGTMFGYLLMIDDKTKKEISDNRILPKAFSIVFLFLSILMAIIDIWVLPNYAEQFYYLKDDGIIRPVGQMMILGYKDPTQYFIHKALNDFFTGITISVYAYNFRRSNCKWYVKTRKVLGYFLLYSLILTITDIHYFDIFELLPRGIMAILCYFLIKNYRVRNKGNSEKTNTENIEILKTESIKYSLRTDFKEDVAVINETPLSTIEVHPKEKNREEKTIKLETMEKRFCHFCGKSIDIESMFCKYCGQKVAQNTSRDSSSLHLSKIIFNNIIGLLSVIFNFIIKGILFVGNIIKGSLVYAYSLLVRFFKYMFKFWKNIAIGGGLILVLLICSLAYDYYTKEYIPNNNLNNAIADITHKFNNSIDSIKIYYAMNILNIEHEWGYDGVNDYSIYYQAENLRGNAFDYIRSQAENGVPICQYYLGRLYYFSNYGVEKDTVKAVYWWNEAAQNGYIDAYNNIGVSYERGMGVKKDLRKAAEWLKKGAEANNAYAQYNYGNMFRDGIKIKIGSHREYGVNIDDSLTIIPKDIEQAKYWWKKAA